MHYGNSGVTRILRQVCVRSLLLIQVANLVYIDYVYRSESNSRSPYWHTKSSTVTHRGIWGRSLPLLMSLVDGHCGMSEPIGWLCLQLDCQPSVAELFRLPPLKSGTLHRNTSSQLPRCSPLGVTWKRFHYDNLSANCTLVDLVLASVT